MVNTIIHNNSGVDVIRENFADLEAAKTFAVSYIDGFEGEGASDNYDFCVDDEGNAVYERRVVVGTKGSGIVVTVKVPGVSDATLPVPHAESVACGAVADVAESYIVNVLSREVSDFNISYVGDEVVYTYKAQVGTKGARA